MEAEYLASIPSLKNLKNGFHANKDCLEVREKVFKLLKKSDFESYIIVARKSENVFRKKFNEKLSVQTVDIVNSLPKVVPGKGIKSLLVARNDSFYLIALPS